MSDTIKKLRGLLVAFDAEITNLHEAFAKGEIDLAEAVNTGRILAEVVNRAKSGLEPLKDRFRDEALAESKGVPGPYYFKGTDGSTCMVVVPKDKISIRRDANIPGLKDELGDRFHAYFVEKVTFMPRKDFTKTAGAHPDEAKKALSIIDFSEGTPRVSFRH